MEPCLLIPPGKAGVRALLKAMDFRERRLGQATFKVFSFLYMKTDGDSSVLVVAVSIACRSLFLVVVGRFTVVVVALEFAAMFANAGVVALVVATVVMFDAVTAGLAVVAAIIAYIFCCF